jgi:hypothetical protein
MQRSNLHPTPTQFHPDANWAKAHAVDLMLVIQKNINQQNHKIQLQIQDK